MRIKQRGFTMIELIAFIVVIGIVATGLLTGTMQVMKNVTDPTKITQASFLASSRMQVILMNRALNGYTSLSDPCTTTPALAICTALSSYATTNSFTVVTSITGANPKIVTVTVSGAGNSVVRSRVYNYANN